jgi:hypothetical protein
MEIIKIGHAIPFVYRLMVAAVVSHLRSVAVLVGTVLKNVATSAPNAWHHISHPLSRFLVLSLVF